MHLNYITIQICICFIFKEIQIDPFLNKSEKTKIVYKYYQKDGVNGFH